MSFEHLSTIDVVRIAAAGGGFLFDTNGKTVSDLVRIAAAAGSSGAKITFKSLGKRPVSEIIRIAAAGKGNITLEE